MYVEGVEALRETFLSGAIAQNTASPFSKRLFKTSYHLVRAESMIALNLSEKKTFLSFGE
jgi:hypothetical protein